MDFPTVFSLVNDPIFSNVDRIILNRDNTVNIFHHQDMAKIANNLFDFISI